MRHHENAPSKITLSCEGGAVDLDWGTNLSHRFHAPERCRCSILRSECETSLFFSQIHSLKVAGGTLGKFQLSKFAHN